MEQALNQTNVNITKAVHFDRIKGKVILAFKWILKIFCAVIGVMFVRSETDKHIEDSRDHVRRLMLGIR